MLRANSSALRLRVERNEQRRKFRLLSKLQQIGRASDYDLVRYSQFSWTGRFRMVQRMRGGVN